MIEYRKRILYFSDETMFLGADFHMFKKKKLVFIFWVKCLIEGLVSIFKVLCQSSREFSGMIYVPIDQWVHI
jgi:hypothetical protein